MPEQLKSRIISMLDADLKRTHRSIADEVGVSRAYVNSVALGIGDSGHTRKNRRYLERHHGELMQSFAWYVRRWIEDTGFKYCGDDRHEGPRILPRDKFHKYRCRKCHAAYQREYMKRRKT